MEGIIITIILIEIEITTSQMSSHQLQNFKSVFKYENSPTQNDHHSLMLVLRRTLNTLLLNFLLPLSSTK